jgi:hypothetical protein
MLKRLRPREHEGNTMSKRKNIVYRDGSWFPMPKMLGETFTSLSLAALKLYLALAVLHKGRVNRFTVSNLDLMKAAKITRDKTFRDARAELVNEGLIQDVKATNGSKRVYEYRLVDLRIFPGSMTSVDVDRTDDGIRWLPKEEMHATLSPTPSLEGSKRRNKRVI